TKLEQWRDELLVSVDGGFDQRVLELGVFRSGVEYGSYLQVPSLLPRERSRVVQDGKQHVEERFRHDPLHFLVALRGGRKLRERAPVPALHRAVELGERIHHDLAHWRLHGLLVLGRVVLEHARDHVARVRRRAEHFRDSLGSLALPTWPDEE